MTVLRAEDLRILKKAETLADEVWTIAGKFDRSTRELIGSQLVRAADSIGANIAEGYGRYHYGERINFFYYARGSLFETKYWLNRCRNRQIVTDKTAQRLAGELGSLAKELNAFVLTIRRQMAQPPARPPKTVKEESDPYLAQPQPSADAAFLSDEEIAFFLT
jgi:four helix bundle protein